MPAELLVTSLHVTGVVTSETMTIPELSATKESFDPSAEIDPTKMMQRWRKSYSQESATTVKTESGVIHVVRGLKGVLKEFHVGSVTAAVGDSTVTINLRKNSSYVLTAELTLDNGVAAYEIVKGSFSDTNLVIGDVLEVVVVATVGTGTLPKGVFATTMFDETPR